MVLFEKHLNCFLREIHGFPASDCYCLAFLALQTIVVHGYKQSDERYFRVLPLNVIRHNVSFSLFPLSGK